MWDDPRDASKLTVRVRFPSAALNAPALLRASFRFLPLVPCRSSLARRASRVPLARGGRAGVLFLVAALRPAGLGRLTPWRLVIRLSIPAAISLSRSLVACW